MEIKLNKEFITLGQLLKVTDFISSGGEAKFMMNELNISVNGERENRRGRKLFSGDVVIIEGKKFEVI